MLGYARDDLHVSERQVISCNNHAPNIRSSNIGATQITRPYKARAMQCAAGGLLHAHVFYGTMTDSNLDRGEALDVIFDHAAR